MGDRVSVSFRNGDDESVTLFSHWGGKGFVNRAIMYIQELIKESGKKTVMPLDRREPNTVMVDFIRYLTKGSKRVTNDLYLGATPDDGDNGDNGHYVINTNDGSFK